MDTIEQLKEQTTQTQHLENLQKKASLHEQKNIYATPQQVTAQTQEIDAHTRYIQQTSAMRDTAKLGKSSFKAKKYSQKQKNQKIQKAKKLTAKATAYTLETQEKINATQALPTANAALMQLSQFRFTPEMFVSSNIRENLTEYVLLIKNYDALMEHASSPEVLERLKPMQSLIAQLRHRLTVYCAQNRVHLTGAILADNDTAPELTKQQLETWYQSVQQYNDPDAVVTNQPTDEQRLAHRQQQEEIETNHAPLVQQTDNSFPLLQREEATATHSDIQNNISQDSLRALNRKLSQFPELNTVSSAIQRYLNSTRYIVGYTKERKQLIAAIHALKDARNQQHLPADAEKLLTQIEQQISNMTNGTLEAPAAKIQDFTGQTPKETGSTSSSKGSTRNALIRKFTHWSDQRDTPLFSHEPVINDLKQRLVSNCYMVASTAGLVDCNPALLKQCIKDNGDGTVTVRLFESVPVVKEKPTNAETPTKNMTPMDDLLDELKEFEFIDEIEETMLVPIYVKVTKEIPRIGSADALSAGALWMQMIEKACAFIGRGTTINKQTGYQSLWYGEGGNFLERLLGISPEIDIDAHTTQENIDAMQDDLFERICHAQEQQIVFNAGSNQQGADGLNAGHAYTVMGGIVKNGQRYVRLRNPYSMHSLQYSADGSSHMSDTIFATSSDATYGQFYMRYEEFLKNFSSITHTDLKKYQG